MVKIFRIDRPELGLEKRRDSIRTRWETAVVLK